MMMGGFGYSWPAMLMMGVGMLLVLVLIAAVIWALVRWLNSQQTPATRPAHPWQDFSQEYEQGYQPQQDPVQRSEETRVTYNDRQQPQPQYEQPQVGYPQERVPPQ